MMLLFLRTAFSSLPRTFMQMLSVPPWRFGAMRRFRRRQWRCFPLLPTISRLPRALSNRCVGWKVARLSTIWLKRALVEEAGRLDVPGRPIAYRTTLHFLRCFGIESLEQLPPLPDQSGQVMLDEYIAGERGAARRGRAGNHRPLRRMTNPADLYRLRIRADKRNNRCISMRAEIASHL